MNRVAEGILGVYIHMAIIVHRSHRVNVLMNKTSHFCLAFVVVRYDARGKAALSCVCTGQKSRMVDPLSEAWVLLIGKYRNCLWFELIRTCARTFPHRYFLVCSLFCTIALAQADWMIAASHEDVSKSSCAPWESTLSCPDKTSLSQPLDKQKRNGMSPKSLFQGAPEVNCQRATSRKKHQPLSEAQMRLQIHHSRDICLETTQR